MAVGTADRGPRFAAGFGIGLLVLPLTALCAAVVGDASVTPLALVALTAGALTLAPRSTARSVGVLTAMAAEVAAGAGVVAWYLMTHDITFG